MKEFLFDTHFHLDLIKDHAVTIEAINRNEIYTIAVTNLPDLYRKEVKSDSKYIKHALGFHPELVSQYVNQKTLMWDLIPCARYIGEVGLDFSNGRSPEQISFFEELIEKIRHEKKIVTLHSRCAVEAILSIIGSDFTFIPILHWYSGNMRDLSIALSRGFYISVNHKMINTHKFASLAMAIPLDRLLLETDLPFSDNGMTQKEALSFVIVQLSRLYRIDKLAMEMQLKENFQKLLYSCI